MFSAAAWENVMGKYASELCLMRAAFDVMPSFFLSVSQHGEQWKEDACTLCMCDQGQVRCHKQACPPLRCAKVFEST